MKLIHLLSILIILVSCSGRKTKSEGKIKKESEQKVEVSDFQTIIDSAGIMGSVLIYDLKGDKYYSNSFHLAKRGNLPASTFKITNSIIALETGTVENDSTVLKWRGEKRGLKIWEQDLIFRDAFHYSCVPCYQKVARKIGEKKMNNFLNKLEYGKMKVDSTNVDLFWLEGESRISQFQQIDFLKRLYQSELPISERTETIIKRMIVIEDVDNYKLSGKTGWSIRNGNNNGWFVGYIETRNRTYFFATNVEPKQQFDMNIFPTIRKDVTFKALKQMEIIK
ncbi:class D beta-lactamase [Croceitalea rosinachiae]|uniref:beta-lactamase n=1 Tax=Croceitalea rosinachiae TaxID=3075596 RepID=A0ABU3ADU4_9FLAO|nr:class D beta-lactamase [Croceitalea sp. F388]MDT0608159.1 class D beta-lactamase [Croceitalea sp. F388]